MVDMLLTGCGREGVHWPPAGSGEAVLAGGVPVATSTLRPCLAAGAHLLPAQLSSQGTPKPPSSTAGQEGLLIRAGRGWSSSAGSCRAARAASPG